MHIKANGDNVLYELARTMTTSGHHSAATALRKLAHAGYTSLEQVDSTSDWILLSIPGIGTKRLGEVRRLSRSDWQPPSSQAIDAASWFLSAARFALRYWSLELLASLVRGAALAKVASGPVEKQLALDVFSVATQKVLCHDKAEAWVLVLQQLIHKRDRVVHGALEIPQAFSSQGAASVEGQPQPSTAKPMERPPKSGVPDPESDHYAFHAKERRRIVEHYRIARRNGEVENKEAWAHNNYGISRKTLWRYEQEFPENEDELPCWCTKRGQESE
jgi:hypothetical protein